MSEECILKSQDISFDGKEEVLCAVTFMFIKKISELKTSVNVQLS